MRRSDLPAKAHSRTPSPASLAPTGAVLYQRYIHDEHEAFVMKLKALRPNVAYYAGCSTFAELARVRYQTQSFT
ncbi:hypothetical protein PMI33_03908 [Pseudomonas sp. GM67]|nr:hypothetical protein PMI33_03908 [Pseudomonas sp. GM67]